MDRYVCTICGYVYDPEQGDPDNGVPAGTKWEDVPDDWECPVCGAGKEDFEKEDQKPRLQLSHQLFTDFDALSSQLGRKPTKRASLVLKGRYFRL